jgi:Triosephosphate isomerase
MKFVYAAALLSTMAANVAAFAPLQQRPPLSPQRQLPLRRLTTPTELQAERKPFITGNWKMNPTTAQEAVALAKGIADSVTADTPGDVALFVPYPYIESVQRAVGDKVWIGAEVRACLECLAPSA